MRDVHPDMMIQEVPLLCKSVREARTSHWGWTCALMCLQTNNKNNNMQTLIKPTGHDPITSLKQRNDDKIDTNVNHPE